MEKEEKIFERDVEKDPKLNQNSDKAQSVEAPGLLGWVSYVLRRDLNYSRVPTNENKDEIKDKNLSLRNSRIYRDEETNDLIIYYPESDETVIVCGLNFTGVSVPLE